MNVRLLAPVVGLLLLAALFATFAPMWTSCTSKVATTPEGGTSRSRVCESYVPDFVTVGVVLGCVGGSGFLLGRAYPARGAAPPPDEAPR
ncbi:MAG TPA: hypothetical protein VHH36_01530 [Candidatus Thermoplasmatota archaeon]|nr:hypothetical protein [Candidatus Thermoplasmatota archaeon]